MNYAAILAGGIGKRMNSTIPKQFLNIGDKPIIIYTILEFIKNRNIDKIIIAIHKEWKSYLLTLLNNFKISDERISVVVGGNERIDTIENIVNFIAELNGVNDDDKIIIHDAVRPFISQRIIDSSLSALVDHSAVVACLPVVDTMLVSSDALHVDSIPNRSTIFHGQAPDSFKLPTLCSALQSLTNEERKQITGTVQICLFKGIEIYMIPGDLTNFKITTNNDLVYANIYLNYINKG